MDPFTNQPYSFNDTKLAADPSEAEFNNGIREVTIFALTGLLFYLGSHAFLNRWRQKASDDEELLTSSWEDVVVYKVSFCLCAFSLAVCFGAALLLPTSTIANEVLHKYPSSWYIQWLNASLIHGFWNLIFILSNSSLFIFLPFAYLFCESEGLGISFLGTNRGLMARAKETIVTLILLSMTVWGMMCVVNLSMFRDTGPFDLAFFVYYLYSGVSFLGVLILLLCTPLGFAHLFTVVGDLLTKPTFTRNLAEEYYASVFEEDSLKHKLALYENDANSLAHYTLKPSKRSRSNLRYREVVKELQQRLSEIQRRREQLEVAKRSSAWKQILGYSFVFFVLLLLTCISLLVVILNVCQIVVGLKSLPVHQESFDLGLTSLSALGVIGVVIEVILIVYLFVTSLIGVYTVSWIQNIRPTVHNTSLTHLILNCGLGVILSSALPLLAKILGITNFDLLGSFGEVKWLNFHVVLMYNLLFAGLSALSLFNKMTDRAGKEMLKGLKMYMNRVINRNPLSWLWFWTRTSPLRRSSGEVKSTMAWASSPSVPSPVQPVKTSASLPSPGCKKP